MLNKPDYCLPCPIAKMCEGFAWGDGNTEAKVAFFGESLGADEVIQGIPFVGGAGRILNKLFYEVGHRRQEFYIHNVINCRPPGNKLENLPEGDVIKALDHCSAYWRKTIREVKPKVLVLFGNWAMLSVLGEWGITKKRGYVWRKNIEGVDLLVIPTIHPMGLVKGERMQVYWGVVRDDIAKAIQIAETGIEDVAESFVIEPNIDQVINCLQPLTQPGDRVWVDLETAPKSRAITCIGIGWSVTEAICIPLWKEDKTRYWSEEELEAVVAMLYDVLAGPRPKSFQNGGEFDIPILEPLGFKVNNWDHDTLAKHHLLYAELPHSLRFQASVYTTTPDWKDMVTEGEEEDTGK